MMKDYFKLPGNRTRKIGKIFPGKEKRKESYIQKMDVIKDAKDALVFYAKDVIHLSQHVIKIIAMSNYYDFDDDGVEIERDDD
ncbi:hypothetical protein U1Q18_048239 [Sarracenia purpurea var. burkii]